MAALKKVLTLVFFVLAQRISGFNISDGGNRQEHAALCSFFTMAGRKLDIPQIDPLAEEEYKYIQELNFTVEPETWQKKFYKEADRTTVHEDANGASLKNVGEDHYWDDWKEAATAFKKGNKDNRVKEILAVPLTSEAKEIAAVDLAAIAENAWTIKNQYPKLTDEQKTYTTTNPPPAIAAALFGGTMTAAGAITQNDPFGQAVASTQRADVCKIDAAGAGPVTATAMLACICHQDTANAATSHECTEKAKPSTPWTSGGTAPAAVDLQKLAKSCGTPPSSKLTAAEIRSAVANLRSLIHIDNNDGYLGHYSATGCNGSSGNGICVKFTKLMTTDKTQFEKKTWVAKFVQAAEIMDSLRTGAAQAAHVNAQLKSMKAEATAAVQRSRVFAATLSQSHTTPVQKQKIDLKTQCDAHNKSKTACLGAQCAWKGQKEDDGPCIPTEAQVAEQEKQKDGGDTTTGGEAKKEEKCKGKLESECTKATNCKWDGKECKDSSFLVNKKLALIAASFSSLVAF